MKLIFALFFALATACATYPAQAAQVKIGQLPPITNGQLALDDVMPLFDTSADNTKKISIEELDLRWAGGGTGNVVGPTPGSTYMQMVPTWLNTDGRTLTSNPMFMGYTGEDSFFYFDSSSDVQTHGQNASVQGGNAKAGANDDGGEMQLTGGRGDGTGRGGNAHVTGGDGNGGRGGTTNIDGGNSTTDGGGDIFFRPGKGAAYSGRIVLLDNRDDQNEIYTFDENKFQIDNSVGNNKALTWYDGTFTTGFQQSGSVGQSVTYTLPDADGAGGDVLSTDGSGVLSWLTPGGGGPSCASSTVTATYSNNITQLMEVCYNGGHISIKISFAMTGGGGSGTNLEINFPAGFTIKNTLGYANAGSDQWLEMCHGRFSDGAGAGYPIMAVPKVGDITKMTVFYQDTPAYSWLAVKNNAPSSQTSGQYLNLTCENVPVNE